MTLCGMPCLHVQRVYNVVLNCKHTRRAKNNSRPSVSSRDFKLELFCLITLQNNRLFGAALVEHCICKH